MLRLDVLQLHANYYELLGVHLSFLFTTTVAVVGSYVHMKMLCDALRQCFIFVDRTLLLKILIKCLEGGKTNQVILRNLSMQILLTQTSKCLD